MKKLVQTGLAAVACLAIAGGALAAPPSNTATAGTTAHIIVPLDLIDSDSLDFGSWATNDTACSITQSPDLGGDGLPSTTGGACFYFGVPMAADDSDWTITGQSGFAYTLTLSGVTPLTGSACIPAGTSVIPPPDTWTFIGNVTGVIPGTAGSLPGGPLTGGPDAFAVGATADLAADQCPGLYGGSFTLTATYP